MSYFSLLSSSKKRKVFFSFFHFEKVLKAVARHLNWVLPSTWRRAIRTNKLFPKAFLSAPNKFDKKKFLKIAQAGWKPGIFWFSFIFSLKDSALDHSAIVPHAVQLKVGLYNGASRNPFLLGKS